MKTLHLTLKKKWFDLIKAGIKKEEYREIKPYWIQRLTWREHHHLSPEYIVFLSRKLSNRKVLRQDFDLVQFKNGYGKDAPTITFECKGIIIAYPNSEHPEWHDGIKDRVFVIKLGNVLNSDTK